MNRQLWVPSCVRSLVVLALAGLALTACGGGGTNGGGGGSDPLEFAALPSFHTMGSTSTAQTFNTVTPTPQSLVGPTDFSAAPAGDANYIELLFSTEVSEASIMNGGIVVKGSDNLERSFFLDKAGAIDPANAFSGDAAPARLRLYFEDPMNPGTPVALAVGGYNLRLSHLLLKSAAGKPFCPAEQSGICMLQSDAVFYFTIGGMNTPGGNQPLGMGPTATLPLPTIMQLDDEIRIFFNRDVDFQSFVGFNTATGLVNVTSQDPFCSVPFPMGQAQAMGANFDVTFTIPAPAVLPPNYGFIAYMPNPFQDASEIRIRFIDITLAVPLDDPMAQFNNLPTTQNYAIPSAIWANALLPAGSPLSPPVDMSPMQNGPLELPPKLPLPGSNSNGNTAVTLSLYDSASALATDSSAVIAANADGVAGITDRARIPLGAPLTVTYTLANGPALRNNPEPPDLHIVGNGHVLDGVSTAANAMNAMPGSTIVGTLFGIADPLDDITVVAEVTDVQFGAFINPINRLTNPPRRLNNASIIAQGIDPGVPFPPGTTAENSVMPPPLPSQPLGARMYVVDGVAEEIKVFNSNTFQSLGTITGVASPRGLSQGGGFMYVSNFGQDTITQFGILPGTPLFHQISNVTSVGAGPTVVTVQPNLEDVGCINSLDNSFSMVDIPTFRERAQFPVGLGASELAISTRWTGQGTTFAFMAYIPNTFSNTVTIFESDSPLLQVPNGFEGKVLEEKTGYLGPLKGQWTRTLGAFNGIGAQGMYVPNSLGNSVTYMGMTFFNLGPAPGFVGPPPSRIFNNIAEYTGTGLNGGPTDCAADATELIIAGGVTSLIVPFPGSGQIASFDATTSILLGTVTVPGNEIFTAADQ